MTRFRDLRGRYARLAILTIALATLSASLGPLGAQDAAPRFAVRPFVGAYLPTGDGRDFLKDATLFGAQASWNASSTFAITTTIGWVAIEEEASIVGQKIDAVHYDVGLEARSDRFRLGPVTPFIGAGLGGRTYSYDGDLDIDSQSNVAGYGALGIDVNAGVVGFRIEGRGNVSQFKPLLGNGANETRNDVTLFAALALRF